MLEFHAPDEEAFPCLALARAAGEAGGSAPCVLNAANEVAVAAFLAGELRRFSASPRSSERTLASAETPAARDVVELAEIDAQARRTATALGAQLVS